MKKLTPFLLSTCVLPGLGQMQVGKKAKGLAFALASLLSVLIPLFLFLNEFWKRSQAKRVHSFLETLPLLRESFLLNWEAIGLGFFLLILVWAWSAWDIWKLCHSRLRGMTGN